MLMFGWAASNSLMTSSIDACRPVWPRKRTVAVPSSLLPLLPLHPQAVTVSAQIPIMPAANHRAVRRPVDDDTFPPRGCHRVGGWGRLGLTARLGFQPEPPGPTF